MQDVIVVGAGPAGCTLASRLGGCLILEEHKSVGLPVQCSGLLTDEPRVRVPEEVILNRIEAAEIITKYNSIAFSLKKPDIVVDRCKFDKAIAADATSNGARILLQHKVVGFKGGFVLASHKNTIKRFPYTHIVGADGPQSVVRKHFFGDKQRLWCGIQARVRMKGKNIIQFYPKTGLFSWVIPESGMVARIGTVSAKNPGGVFRDFLAARAKHCAIIEMQGGLIPVYDRHAPTQKGNIYLVGDAAGQVKATTGGGIIPGICAARILARCVETGADYDRMWKKEIGRDLYYSYLARKALDSFSERDYDRLIGALKDRRVKSIVESVSRDSASLLMPQLLLKKPQLFYYGIKGLAKSLGR